MKGKLLLSLLAVFTLSACGATNTDVNPVNPPSGDTDKQDDDKPVNPDDDKNDDDQPVDTTVHVQSVKFEVDETDLTEGDIELIAIEILPSNATNKKVTFSSSNPDIADIDFEGNVTAYKEGKCVLTVTSEDGNKKGTCTINVEKKPGTDDPTTYVKVTSVSLNLNSLELEEGDSETLSATVSPDDATNPTIKWSSSNETVAVVGSTGKVVAKKAGTATITVTSVSDTSKKATCNVTVTAKPVEPEDDEGEIVRRGIQDTTILHCWNWSMNTIKNNLDEIKAAGYKTIQLSPMQPQKDPYQGEWRGQWWKLYQPLGFKVAGSGQNVLGSKDELKSMCDAAEAKGIKVIVDIVSNHLGGGDWNRINDGARNYEPEIYNNELIHKNGIGSAWSSTFEITKYALGGYPDIQTENTTVQNSILGMLKDYVDCGIDGFRFDAAKHIETPDDGEEYASNYWPTVLNGVANYATSKGYEKPYVYGEILGAPGSSRSYSSYTKYMSVTDNRTGFTVLKAIKENNVGGLSSSSYSDGLKGEKVVLWAESHDTYANDERETTDVSIDKIHKAYAVQASRKDAASLYFARPNDGGQMGQIGKTNYKDAEIVAANKFHNAFVGRSEALSTDNGCFVNVRGKKGAAIVAVNNNNSSIQVNVPNLANGSYTDLVTNKSYTVSNGKVTVNLSSSGIAFLIDPNDLGEAPSISFGDYNAIYSGSQNITVNVSGNPTSVKYQINNGVETVLSGSTINLPSSLSDGAITIKVTASNKFGSSNQTISLCKSNTLANKSIIVTNIDSSYDYGIWTWKEGVQGVWKSPSKEGNAIGFDVSNGYKYILVVVNKGQTLDWGNKVKQTNDADYTKQVVLDYNTIQWR
ncbi:MAG: Ig-like domain-containing protein [Bacilli bacterium]|nr:Ig-like domain-containing protein [Bacilli bacterium]